MGEMGVRWEEMGESFGHVSHVCVLVMCVTEHGGQTNSQPDVGPSKHINQLESMSAAFVLVLSSFSVTKATRESSSVQTPEGPGRSSAS